MKAKFIFIAIVCLIANHTFGQSELIKELNDNILEVKTLSPDSDFSDLNELNHILRDKRIIGLGEATHATSEFFKYKHRLIKYLVTKENYKVFIIEGDFSGSQAMNDYVVHGKGTIRDGFIGMGYGVWCREEFVDLVEWMKEYNVNKAIEDKIKFYGCDINNEVITAKKVKKYLNETGKLNDTLKDGLNWIINQDYRKKLSNEDEYFRMQFLIELNDAFKSTKDENSGEVKFIKHCKRELEQIFELIFADEKTHIMLRDKFMAENIEWIYNTENHQKSIFWAHNEHVKNDKAKSNQKPTGYYLKEKFDGRYYSFGFGFNDGKVGGYNGKEKRYDSFEVPAMSEKKLIDAVFSKCAYSEFILDLESANANDIIRNFLNTNLYQRSISTGFYPKGTKQRHFRMGKLIDKYDGFIFIRNSNPPTQLK